MGASRANIKTTLVIDGQQQYTRAIDTLRAQQRALRSEAKALASTYDQNTTSADKLKDKQKILSQQIDAQRQIVSKLENEYNKLSNAENVNQEEVAKAASKYNNAGAVLNKLESELRGVNAQLDTNAYKWKENGKKVTEFGTKIEGVGNKLDSIGNKSMLVSGAVAGGMYKSLESAVKAESAFTGVKKTVDATDEEYKQLYNDIVELSKVMPPSIDEISEVAEIAGQLGIQKENLMEFTETMINLGQSTNLSATEGASALAKFANVTNMDPSNYERLGSVIVDLGNNFATTEADIVSMATRLGSTGSIVGLNQRQIMALATALSSVGIEAEAGGSTASKVLKKIQVAVETNSKSLKDWASVSNMSEEEFKKLWAQDKLAALGAFTQGLNDVERNGKTATVILEEMGLKEVRLSNTLLALSTSKGNLAKAVDMSNNAWDNNMALQEEADKRYATMESRFEMVKNKINACAIELGEGMMPVAEKSVDKIGDLTEKFADLSDEEKETILKTAGVVAISGPLLKIIGTTTQGVGKLVKTGGELISLIGRIKAGEQVTGIAKIVSIVMANGPLVLGIGATIAAIGGLIAVNKQFNYGNKETRETFKDLGKSIDDFKDKIQQAQGDIENIKKSISFDEKSSELENQYESIAQKIKDIAVNSANGRMELTDAEISKLNELFHLMDDISEKQIALFTDSQNALQTMIGVEDSLTDEQAAEMIAKNQNILDELTGQIENNYEYQITLLNQKYSTEESRRSDAYRSQMEHIKSLRDEQIKAAKEEAAENDQLIAQKMIGNQRSWDSLINGFQDYNNQMSNAYDNAINTANEKGQRLIGALSNYVAEQKITNDEFAEKFLSSNQETIANFIAMCDEMINNGEALSTEQSNLLGEILKAYNTLPKSASKAWEETMNNIITTIDTANIEGKGEELGTNYLAGITSGINKSEKSVLGRIRAFFRKFRGQGEEELDTHSPSKKAEWLAEMYNAGIDKGLIKSQDKVLKTAKNQMHDLMDVYSSSEFISPNPALIRQVNGAFGSTSSLLNAVTQQTIINNSAMNNYYSSPNSNADTLERILGAVQGIGDYGMPNITRRQAGYALIELLASVGVDVRKRR